MEAVRALEPVASELHDASVPGQTGQVIVRSNWLHFFATSAILALFFALTQPGPPTAPIPVGSMSARVAGPATVAPTPPPHHHPALFDATPNPYPSSAVAAAETFIATVNSGDSDAVLELLVDHVARPGTGTAQFPHLPTDAGLWIEGVLDHSNVEGFVQYVAALPGPVEVSDCASVAGGVVTTLVGCTYSTGGGVLAALGEGPETGLLYVVTLEDKVAGLIHAGDGIAGPWDRFATWVASNHPNRLSFDSGYSRESALHQSRLAHEMAAALAIDSYLAGRGHIPG